MIDERLTKAIAVPKTIELEDGRTLLITAWNPVVEVGGIVRLNASFIVADANGKPVLVGESN